MSAWQGSNAHHERSMTGVIVGIVEETTGDPERLGRIKVQYPLFGATIMSNWCRVASFFAGKDVGAYFLPAKGDEVLVIFEAGNLNVPYVIGSLWNGQDRPPVAGEQKQQDVRMIKTRSGSQICIDDTPGAERIEVTDKSGGKIVLDSKPGAEKIEVIDKSGDKVVLDAVKRSVTIAAGGDIDVSAGPGKITLKATQIELSATAAVKISAQAQVEVSSTGDVAVKGALIRLN